MISSSTAKSYKAYLHFKNDTSNSQETEAGQPRHPSPDCFLYIMRRGGRLRPQACHDCAERRVRKCNVTVMPRKTCIIIMYSRHYNS